MFDPSRLLQQMLGGALGGAIGGGRGRSKHRGGVLGGVGGGSKAALGLGALGVAMAAWEHYQGQSKAGNTAASAPASSATAPSLELPPPPPGALPQQSEALNVIRSMIAAAAADGLIDGNEREAILRRAEEAGMNSDDRAGLQRELMQPLSLPELVSQTPAGYAAEVYVAALITISIDTEAERRWMQRLAEGLHLSAEQTAELDARFCPTPPSHTPSA